MRADGVDALGAADRSPPRRLFSAALCSSPCFLDVQEPLRGPCTVGFAITAGPRTRHFAENVRGWPRVRPFSTGQTCPAGTWTTDGWPSWPQCDRRDGNFAGRCTLDVREACADPCAAPHWRVGDFLIWNRPPPDCTTRRRPAPAPIRQVGHHTTTRQSSERSPALASQCLTTTPAPTLLGIARPGWQLMNFRGRFAVDDAGDAKP